jgi:LssY C-terminus
MAESGMAESGMTEQAVARDRWRMPKRVAVAVVALLLIYGAVTYLLVPALWTRYSARRPALEDIPGIAHTGNGIPDDPLNVALVGAKGDLIKIMLAAKWHPADPLCLKSCLEIAEATVLKRPYEDAPVSNLYLWGRKEDLAFEQQVGDDPRHRHHVRFWKAAQVDAEGRPLWVGSATYDKSVGLSHTTGQITHHIGADVDAERDHFFQTLKQTGNLADKYVVDGFHKAKDATAAAIPGTRTAGFKSPYSRCHHLRPRRRPMIRPSPNRFGQ